MRHSVFITAERSKGFTLIELLVVIAIIGILATLLPAALRRAKTSANSATCRNNLRQIGVGLRLYVDEYERYPLCVESFENGDIGTIGIQPWKIRLRPFLANSESVFQCPFLRLGRRGLYGFNYNGVGDRDNQLGLDNVRDSQVAVPSDMIAIGDAVYTWFGDWIVGFGYPGCALGPHRVRSRTSEIAVFCDGHVESSDSSRMPRIPDENGWQFKPTEAHAKRWNNDNQPHPETWPAN